jgi:hypothetical protein
MLVVTSPIILLHLYGPDKFLLHYFNHLYTVKSKVAALFVELPLLGSLPNYLKVVTWCRDQVMTEIIKHPVFTLISLGVRLVRGLSLLRMKTSFV